MTESQNKLINPTIFKINKKLGELEEINKVSERDISVLKRECILDDNFNLDKGYFPPKFVDELVMGIREKYSDLVKDLPIDFVDCSKENNSIEPDARAGLTILYGSIHTKLIVRRPLSDLDGRTEIYVMDSCSNTEDQIVDRTYGDPTKFIVKYPATAKFIDTMKKIDVIENRRQADINSKGMLTEEENCAYSNELSMAAGCRRNSIWVQMDNTHCISHAIHFAGKIYKAVRNEVGKGGTDVMGGFNKVMGGLESYTRFPNEFEKANEKLGMNKKRDMFLFPDFLLKYSGSEGALHNAAYFENTGDRTEIAKELKRKILPYKNKRAVEMEKELEKLKDERTKELKSLEKKLNLLFNTVERLKLGGEKKNEKSVEEFEGEIEEKLVENDENIRAMDNKVGELGEELRSKYSIGNNWRNKDFRMVAERIVAKTQERITETNCKRIRC